MSAPASSSSASGGGGTAPAAWNLKHMLAKRLLRELISKSQSAARQSGGGGVVLVVDPHTSKILSSCLRMHDLLSAGVLVLQQLHLRRERVPELPAVYFVEPSAEALEVIAEDFPKPPPSATPAGKEHAGAGAIIEGAMQALHLKGGGAAANGTDPAKAAAAAAAANRCHYLCAHLFFTRSVSAKRMAWLSKDSGMDMRKVKSFVELGADFLAFESRVFLLDRPHTIPRLYPLPPDDDDQAAVEGPSNSELLPLVAQLLSVCSTVLAPGERPYVRYISSHVSGQSRSALSQRFAELVDRELTKAAKATAAASPSSPPPSAPRNTTLLVVDRSLDPLTPLMHEFTYQAMLNDLLKVQGEIVTLPVHQDKSKGKTGAAGESGEGKQPPAAPAAAEGEDPASSGEFVLSEDDALWCQYRHRHIGTVMAGVNRKLKEFAASNQMAQYQLSQAKLKGGKDGKGKDSIKDVLKAVSSLPEYKQAMKGYAKHLALSEECLSKFTSRHLALVGELEQSVAANSTPEGVVYAAGSRELREALKALVLDRAPELEGRPLGLVDKLRLVVIFSLVHGGLPSNLQKVLSASLHPELVEAVLGEQSHLRSLGAQLDAFEVQVSRARIDELNERNLAQPLALMRYVPVLHGILEALLRNELPETMFPYTKVGGAPPKRDAGASGSNTPTHGMGSRRGSSSVSTTGSGGANEEQLRAKLLAEAEMDVAHRALGRSARRHKADRDPAAAAAAQQSLPATPAAAAAASMSTDGLSSSDDPLHPHQHRYIVFMLGGLSFSEMRSSYEVSAAHGLATGSGPDAPLLVGSTAALTPAEYLLDVSGLTRKEFYDKVLASASTAAAHSIASSELEHRPVLAAKGQRSDKALTEEEREERAARERMAEALRGTGDDEEDVSDVSDPGDSDDEFDSPSPPPVARGSAAHSKQSLMQSSAATSRNGAVGKGKNGAPAAPSAPSASASAAAAKKSPAAASVAKKTKELVFESESEGEQRDDDGDDDDAYDIDPSPSPSSARGGGGGGAKAKGQAQAAAANGKGGRGSSRDPAPAPAAKGKGAASSSSSSSAAGTKKSSRRRNDSDED